MSRNGVTGITQLSNKRRRWLVTGVAGFIGSNLLECLLRAGQEVVGLDNFATGHQANLDEVRESLGEELWGGFRFIEGDICDLQACEAACERVEIVLHQAALGSVPRSIENPLRTNAANITGFLAMLESARKAGVQRFVYAASSSTYGDHPGLPKQEDRIGNPLSPYAVTKYVNELYADVFARCYGFEAVGLRYFNVFGRRQDPDGPYAAVIPKWIKRLIEDQAVEIYGDGETSRDFCYIDNAVQANVLAGLTEKDEALNQVYNVAVGERTSLNELYGLIRARLSQHDPELSRLEPVYRDFRPGDVRHSQADISKARGLLRYSPSHRIDRGLDEAMDWYRAKFAG